MRILIIEDEKEIADGLTSVLAQNGYIADAVYDGLSGLEYCLSNIYDLILLDIMLPKLNGLDILKNIRAEKIDTPVILLTAKSDIEDRIRGLDCGADDYLSKPFATGELLARIRARTRQSNTNLDKRKKFGDIAISQDTFELSCGTYSIKMGNKEFQLLDTLMSNSGRILPRDVLIEKIWGPWDESSYNQLEVYVSFLRKKLRYVHSKVEIKNTKNVGYSIEYGGESFD